jgi:hypothetical protein
MNELLFPLEDLTPKLIQTSGKFSINRLVFNCKDTTAWFLPERAVKHGKVQLFLHDLPAENQSILFHQAQNDKIWGDFTESVNEGCVPVYLQGKSSATGKYLSWCLQKHFIQHGFITGLNFFHATEVWIDALENAPTGCTAYSKYVLETKYDLQQRQYYLLVNYTGSAFVHKKSISELSLKGDFDQSGVKKVIYRKGIYRMKELPINEVNQGEIYPLMNYNLYQQLGIKPLVIKEKKPHSKRWVKTDHFYRNHLLTDAFREWAIIGKEWEQFTSLSRIQDSGRMVEFGNQFRTEDLIDGFRNARMYKLPAIRQINVFYIFATRQKTLYESLHLKLSNQWKLNPINGVNLYYDLENNISFSMQDDPLNEISQKISMLALIPSQSYLAIYMSPYDQFNNDVRNVSLSPGIKEALLRRGIMSQVISADKFISSGDNFRYWLPNISLATLTKFGAIPWIRPTNLRKELVIGFGIYRSKKNYRELIGASVCFRNDGSFESFDAFPSQESYQLVSLFEKAIVQYREHNPDIKRIVIHYYKQISARELDPLENLLQQMELNIPLIVIRINRTSENTYLIADHASPDSLPVNGSYYSLGKGEYMLYLNERQNNLSAVKAAPEGLRLGIYSSVGTVDDALAGELLQQVYDACFLNWRSVRPGHIPATIKYPSLLASYVAYFKGQQLLDEGRKSLWVL